MFFRSVQLRNLISRNFCYHVMQQYRYSNFSDVFCLSCIFVIDAAVKQLVSRSFLKYGVFAVGLTTAAHKIFSKKSNLHCRSTRFIDSRSTEAWERVAGPDPVAKRLGNTAPKNRRNSGEPLITRCPI